MADTKTKVGHGLAKVLGIKLDYRNETGDKATRGESTYSISSADSYDEEEPKVIDWFREITPTGRDVANYVWSLFPFTHWIGFYNVQWLIGDLVAGITIGAVVVPQGMAYAQLAELPVEFGLYSSFMGVLVYWFFATSKDITIGPVAVMSQITGNIVVAAAKARPDIPGHVVASSLALICGAIVTFLGVFRLGFLVEFISLAAVCAYMTGAAINIAAGQVPALMGITGFSTRAAPYKVIINTLKGLPRTKLDAALGLTALTMLYLIRFIFNYLAKKQPQRKRVWFFCNTLRSVFVILLYTLIGWLCNLHLPKHNSKKSPFKILGHVPRGFQDAGAPDMSPEIINLYTSQLPAAVIVLLIEHISIAKSFGRVNNYMINPSQELVAIGVTNLLAPFLGGYPATGSFSRTAIKSKAGVRTPLAGVITALVVLLAIYALPAVFFYIPSAALSAVIIHAVGDLITPPNVVYQFWKISPIEVPIFLAGVIVTVFTTIEDGVYVVLTTSFALLVWRIFKARGRFLGKVQIHSVVGDHVLDEQKYGTIGRKQEDPDKVVRNLFLPIEHDDGSNPNIKVEHPYPGVFIYRFSENYTYMNASHYLDYMVMEIFKQTRRTNPSTYGRLGDRPWNDPGPNRKNEPEVDTGKPTLKAIIMDFSSVNNVDVTSVQHLIDVRNQLDRYASPDAVQWHFACITNRWTKRALVAAGFGYPTPTAEGGFQRWKPIYSVAEIGGQYSAAAAAEAEQNRREMKSQQPDDIEQGQREVDGADGASSSRDSVEEAIQRSKAYKQQGNVKVTVVHGLNRPFFHMDLTSALQSAVHNIEEHQQGGYGPVEGTEEEHAKGEKYA